MDLQSLDSVEFVDESSSNSSSASASGSVGSAQTAAPAPQALRENAAFAPAADLALGSNSHSNGNGKGKRKAGAVSPPLPTTAAATVNDGQAEEQMMLHSQSLPVDSVAVKGDEQQEHAAEHKKSSSSKGGPGSVPERPASPNLRSGSDPDVANGGSSSSSGSGSGSGSGSPAGNGADVAVPASGTGKRQKLSNGHFPLASINADAGDDDAARSDGAAGQQASRFILANSYPPMNLSNADSDNLPAFSAVSARENGNAVSSDQNSSSTSTPFNYDVAAGRAIFPDPLVPGMIPPFSGSKTESLARASGQQQQMAAASSSSSSSSSAGQAGSSLAAPPPVREPLLRNRSSRDGSNASGSSNAELFGACTDTSDFKLVRFGAGIRAQALDAVTSTCASSAEAAAAGGYFVPQACYPVGTAIFSTGGYGFLSRLYGLSMDQVTSYEIVLPHDGRVVTLHQDWRTRKGLSDGERQEQEELWFVMRGAGTAFAVITTITAKAYRVGKVLAGNVIL